MAVDTAGACPALGPVGAVTLAAALAAAGGRSLAVRAALDGRVGCVSFRIPISDGAWCALSGDPGLNAPGILRPASLPGPLALGGLCAGACRVVVSRCRAGMQPVVARPHLSRIAHSLSLPAPSGASAFLAAAGSRPPSGNALSLGRVYHHMRSPQLASPSPSPKRARTRRWRSSSGYGDQRARYTQAEAIKFSLSRHPCLTAQARIHKKRPMDALPLRGGRRTGFVENSSGGI
ncbi:hypothetical protein SAMN05421512_112139 [Stappia indica]|uniref:Uncharacterized protein n=1 Tax=Stappia indica TaxID=538381 RepID=A0A285TPT1_9HYPH|nr:hypothetical protein SAMN05421512_112139 [Stappia indica]